MPSWIWIVIACALFLLSVKAILWLGFRHYVRRLHAEFLAYLKTRFPCLMLIDRADKIELRLDGKKIASVAWRFLYKRISELPKEMPNRHMAAFDKFAAFIERIIDRSSCAQAEVQQMRAPHLALPGFEESERSGILIFGEGDLRSKLTLIHARDCSSEEICVGQDMWNHGHEDISSAEY